MDEDKGFIEFLKQLTPTPSCLKLCGHFSTGGG